ncbi:unnamed protein product [Phytophthora fragariaefolia]|uniref:Unnamed protein product n=1 Tax=Phytophthora fragariaefolia TaxID=1490495 RepID=A0A9W6YB85_9STRA|nr:unnamed protein product [Phytophthora fragariaefolia]
MSSSYADTVKLVEDNYFHWEFNMRMKLSRKGLLVHIVKPEFDAVSDRSTVQWKTNDLMALGVIAGDVSLTYQVYIRGATTGAEAWRLLEEQFNRNTLKNRLIVTKKLHNFKMEPGTRFTVHVDRFKELVLQIETIVEALDETRQLFVSMKELKMPVRITIADGTKIDAVVTGTVRSKLMDGTTVTLSDVLYIPETDLGGEAGREERRCAVQQGQVCLSLSRCNIHGGVTEGICLQTKDSGGRGLLSMADGVPRIADDMSTDNVCAECCMGKMRADDFPRQPANLVQSASILELVHSDVTGPMQTRSPGGCTFAVPSIDDYCSGATYSSNVHIIATCTNGYLQVGHMQCGHHS